MTSPDEDDQYVIPEAPEPADWLRAADERWQSEASTIEVTKGPDEDIPLPPEVWPVPPEEITP